MPEPPIPATPDPDNRFTPVERIEPAELALRHARTRAALAELCPGADGLLACGRTTIYYLTGTAATGLVWLPMTGEPVLMVRKGLERARLESSLTHVEGYRSYRDLARLAAEAGSPLGSRVAVDRNRFSWANAELLASRLPGVEFVGGDGAIARARAVKTPFEVARLMACGRLHARLLDEVLPARVRPGMSEYDIACAYVEELLRGGSDGLTSMAGFGEQMYHGYASAGTTGVYPTYFNGPLGCRGVSPSTPFLGSKDVFWEKGQPLTVDMGCTLMGYVTDRTQTYWSGPASSIPDLPRRAQDACVDILERAVGALRPGNTPAQIWGDAAARARELGFEEQFMGVGRDRLMFLGHGVGLDLDEWPPIARTFTRPLEPGMVMAIEPKIGLPGIGMVGVENTYLVTEGAAKPVTGSTYDFICVE